MNALQVRQLTERNDFSREVKKALKENFPTIKFSVRGTTYGYFHIQADYDSIEQEEAVRSFLQDYDCHDEDFMTDYAGSGWKLLIL